MAESHRYTVQRNKGHHQQYNLRHATNVAGRPGIEEDSMISRRLVYGATLLSLVAFAISAHVGVRAQAPKVAIDNDDIGGVVTGPKGPEAGVWVIAETADLPT